MSYFPHGAFIAIHAAHKKQLEDQQEEEAMTNYSLEELEHHYEFKIVRSETAAFRKPEAFERLLQEEAMAGWELLEKLDDRRVRFKRRRDARRNNFNLPPGFDPYRTVYDNSNSRVVIILLVALVMAIGVITSLFLAAGISDWAGTFSIAGLVVAAAIILLVSVISARRKG